MNAAQTGKGKTRLKLLPLQVEYLLKIGANYANEDGTMMRSAYANIAKDAALVIGEMSTEQVKKIFKKRREHANAFKKRKLLPPDDGTTKKCVPIKNYYGYNQQTPLSGYGFLEVQQQCLQQKEKEIQLKTEELNKNLQSLNTLNQERDALKRELEERQKEFEAQREELEREVSEKERMVKDAEFQQQALKEKVQNITKDSEKFQQTVNEAETRVEQYEEQLHFLQVELEQERNRSPRDDPYEDTNELRRRIHGLEDQLDNATSLISSLRYQVSEERRYSKNLEESKEFYKSQYQERMHSVVQDTIEYWKNCYYELVYEKKQLEKIIRELQDRQEIANTIWRIIWSAAKTDKIVTYLIDTLVTDNSLRNDLMKPGMLVKLRYMGEFCFMRANSMRQSNDQLLYFDFIKRWDDLARNFCQTRNKVCHDFEYLENLSASERLVVATEYKKKFESIIADLESIEKDVKNRRTSWRHSDFPDQNQKKSRLKELRLPIS